MIIKKIFVIIVIFFTVLVGLLKISQSFAQFEFPDLGGVNKFELPNQTPLAAPIVTPSIANCTPACQKARKQAAALGDNCLSGHCWYVKPNSDGSFTVVCSNGSVDQTFVDDPTSTPSLPACGTQCQKEGDCTGAKDGCTACVSGVCKTPPACNVACSKDSDCDGAKDSCTVCLGGACKKPPACGGNCDNKDPNSCSDAKDGCTLCGTNNTCQKPPACNVACTKDGDCTGAKDGCTACVSGVCKTPPACGAICSKDGDCAGVKDGCSTCTNNKCSTPPTPTPTTDPFSQNMCKCDGLEAGTIVRGEKTAITAFGKVEGGDGNYAKISSFTFTLYKGADKIVTIDKKENLAAVVAETTAQKTRYKATWDLDVPSTMEKGQVYRVQAVPSCDKKTAFVPVIGNTTILGASTEKRSFFDNIAAFFTNLFGGVTDTTTQNQPPTITPKPIKNAQLNIKTFVPPTPTDTPIPTPTTGPAQITQQSCEFFLFKFE